MLFLFSSIAFSNAFGFIYWFIISSGLWPYKAGFVNNIGINGALCRRNIFMGMRVAASLLIVNKFLKINTTFFLDIIGYNKGTQRASEKSIAGLFYREV